MYSDEPILQGIRFEIVEEQTKCFNPICYRTKLRCKNRLTSEQKQFMMDNQDKITKELYLKWFHNSLQGAN